MKILVKSNDAKLMEKLTYFAEESNIEYEKMRKGLKLRALGITGRIPLAMGMMAKACPEGGYLDLPWTVPELDILREVIKRYLHRDLGEPKWKRNMLSQVNGYLLAEGVEFRSIELMEEEKHDDDSVQGKKEESDSDSGQG
jgi:hypothetical protein